MKMSPCKSCESRHPGCHSKCEPYKEWKVYRNELSEHLKKIRGMESDVMRMEHIRQAQRREHI